MNTEQAKLPSTLQIAGMDCNVCRQSIVIATEGKFCPHCQAAVHIACEPRDTCCVCGQAYRYQERPKVDPLTEAIVPRALRPARSGAGALAVFIMGTLSVVILVIWFALTHMTAK